jgi:hypothetical protein
LIIPEDEVENYAEIHIKRKIHSVLPYREFNRFNKCEQVKDDLRNICWICDGWAENNFKWDKGVSGPDDLDMDPGFIHFRH